MNAPHTLPDLDADDPVDTLALDALTPGLADLDRRIERELQRLRARYELTLDELRGLYVSDAQVDALLQPALADDAADDDPLPSPADAYGLSPWQALADTLVLAPLEQALLLAILAPDVDRKYAALYAYLNDDAGGRAATPDLLMRLYGARDARQRQAVRTASAPSGRLIELGLVQPAGAGHDAARPQQALRVQPALADWLLGLPYADPRLMHVAQLHWPAEAAPLAMAQPTGRRVQALANAVRERRPLAPILCIGSPLPEAIAVARELLAAAERPALQLDLHALRSASAPGDVADAAALMARVFGVGLVLAPLSALVDADGRCAEPAGAALRRLAAGVPCAVLADADRRTATAVLGETLVAGCQELVVAELSVGERIDAWRVALEGRADGSDIAALADRYALGPARIAQAVAAAAQDARLAGDERPDRAQLFDAARAVSASATAGVVRSVSSPFDWDDLVLPPTVRERLLDIVRAVELRPRVLEDWGFARRVGNARGVKAMFAGPSGTGKTMAAAIIARTLALDMHRVELAAVVSKYIGETEKNLDRAFDAARCANAILFIDEADALFGKRSEVKDAHDRYANVETAYLLQKMEDHDGVVILATNLANHIDEAYSRRMHFVVEFPLPDVARREQLWRGMFPAAAPLAPDIDFGFLARQFAFAGGDIRNIVLDAAYAAADTDDAISMAHLLRAVARQYAKRGKLPSAAEFREYQALLAAPGGG